MSLEFAGPATPLSDHDIEAAAGQLGCQVAAVRAVIDVESRGGFLPDKRPKILFERHYFHRLSGGSFSAGHPDISHPVWGGYGAAGAAQSSTGLTRLRPWPAIRPASACGLSVYRPRERQAVDRQ